MQLIGIVIAFVVVSVGFLDRGDQGISFFDWHALVIILLGCFGATLLGSSPRDFARTFSNLRELLPFLGRHRQQTEDMEGERLRIENEVLAGNKAEAIRLAEASQYPSSKLLAESILRRANDLTIDAQFTNLSQKQLDELQPSARNWDLMGKLAPSFGMVGTLTGMIQLFKHFDTGGSKLGTSLSLALLATLYGISFGAAIAGPIGHFLGTLMDQRLDVLERCEKSAKRLTRVVAS